MVADRVSMRFYFVAVLAVLLLSAPLTAQSFNDSGNAFGGPTLMSRGQGANFGRQDELASLRFGAGVNGIYDTGLTNVSVNSQGEIPKYAATGVESYLGAAGVKPWRHTFLSLEYRGNYRAYTRNQYFNGSDQNLSLSLQHQPSRRWILQLRETAGTFARNYFATGAFGVLDPNFALTPTNEFFDNRTTYLSSLGDATYIASARTSFNVGADGFLIRRRSNALADMTGARVRADVAHRLTRRFTVSFGYQYNYWEFRKTFGSTNLHLPYVNLAWQLGKYWDLNLNGGVYRQESQGLNTVTIDPAVAAIIGRSQGVVATYSVNWLPQAAIQLNRRFQHGMFSVLAGRTVSNGNGLVLTSRNDQVGFTFSRALTRKVGLDWNFQYYRLKAVAFNVSQLNQVSGGVRLNYALTRAWHISANYLHRYSDSDNTLFQRNSTRMTLGVAFSPGDLPLTFW